MKWLTLHVCQQNLCKNIKFTSWQNWSKPNLRLLIFVSHFRIMFIYNELFQCDCGVCIHGLTWLLTRGTCILYGPLNSGELSFCILAVYTDCYSSISISTTSPQVVDKLYNKCATNLQLVVDKQTDKNVTCLQQVANKSARNLTIQLVANLSTTSWHVKML